MDSSEPQSPQSPTISFIRGKQTPQNLMAQSLGFSVPSPTINKVHQILNKLPETRRTKQIQYIHSFIKENPFLEWLAENIDLQFVKNIILKYAQCFYVDEGKIIAEAQNKIDHLFVLVEGSLEKIKNASAKTVHTEDVYENLITAANKYTRDLSKVKEVGNRMRRISFTLMRNQQLYKKYIPLEQDEKEAVEHVGVYDLSLGFNYLHTVVTTSQSLLIRISKHEFMMNLQQTFQAKMKELELKVNQLPCFSIPYFLQQKQKLSALILSFMKKRKKRGEYIYHQNDPVTHIYLLKRGEVKLAKETKLFEEDPNNLYMNRVKLMTAGLEGKQQQKYEVKQFEKNRKQAILPYADLRKVYHFHPKTKNIDIGILSPFCLFGEEDIEKKTREASAVCNSLQVSYYQISIKRIEQITTLKHMPKFLQQLKNSTKQKVLYRQNLYANTINLQNKSNLDYFYIEGEEEVETPRKFRIAKFNKMLTPENKKSYSSPHEKFTTPAFYTTFNFHKMSVQDNPEVKKKQVKQKKVTDDSQIMVDERPTHDELRIFNMTHTWKLMKRKLDIQGEKSKKISAQKQTININRPLIENKFFNSVEKERKRIERMARIERLSLGISKKSGRNTIK